MKHFKLTIIASVEPGQPWTLRRLDQLEGDFQKRLMCMDYNGGMNRRDETVRRRQGSWPSVWYIYLFLKWKVVITHFPIDTSTGIGSCICKTTTFDQKRFHSNISDFLGNSLKISRICLSSNYFKPFKKNIFNPIRCLSI